jgi:hypothetical protein
MQQRQIPHTITIIALILCVVFTLKYGIGYPSRQQPIALTTTVTDRFPPSFTPSMPTRSKETEKRRKEEEAMAHGTLEREKEAVAQRLQEEAAKATAAAGMMQPTVVSPPPASNLNTLLTGHVGQDTNGTKEDGAALTTMDDKVSGENGKPPKQKKIRKLKLNKEEKDDVATKKEHCSSALKQGSVAVPLPTLRPPAPAYKYERVFYKAGLELKGEDKYGAYVKQIGSLLENIQLVDPSAILHAAVEWDATKPIGKKEELSDKMTIFLAYAPVGKNQNAFKPKKRTTIRRKEDVERMSRNYLILVSIPLWSSPQM